MKPTFTLVIHRKTSTKDITLSILRELVSIDVYNHGNSFNGIERVRVLAFGKEIRGL